MQIGPRLISSRIVSSTNNNINHIEANLSLSKDFKDFKEKHNKDYTCFHRMVSMANLKFITKYIAILLIVVVVVLIGMKSNNHNLFNLLSKDRSEAYNVKVLPDNLDDTSLNLLDKEAFSYLAMIDAGSSGCRAHVYRYGKLGSIKGPLYVLPQHESFKVKPGLSTFANHPQDAGKNKTKDYYEMIFIFTSSILSLFLHNHNILIILTTIYNLINTNSLHIL